MRNRLIPAAAAAALALAQPAHSAETTAYEKSGHCDKLEEGVDFVVLPGKIHRGIEVSQIVVHQLDPRNPETGGLTPEQAEVDRIRALLQGLDPYELWMAIDPTGPNSPELIVGQTVHGSDHPHHGEHVSLGTVPIDIEGDPDAAHLMHYPDGSISVKASVIELCKGEVKDSNLNGALKLARRTASN